MKRLLAGLAVVVLVGVSVGQARAERVRWAINGHYYEAVSVGSGGISWDDAKAAAEAVGGHLATITSSQENDFVLSLIGGPQYWISDGGSWNLGPWLGGYQSLPSTLPDDNWQWVTGEGWEFTSWAPNNPNDAHGEEDKLHFYDVGASQPRWNDLDTIRWGWQKPVAYIVEIVPEPSTFALLAIGAFALIAYACQKRCRR